MPTRQVARAFLELFDDIGFFMLNNVEPTRRLQPHWQAVRKDLPQARFGARQLETVAEMRAALATEGWVADKGAGHPGGLVHIPPPGGSTPRSRGRVGR